MKLRIVGLLIGGMLAFIAPVPATAFIYYAEPTEGWVVDAETGRPIEGVVVVGHWQLRGGFEGGTPISELEILETVTDQDGRYYLPGWGPKFAFQGQLKSQSPTLLLFKPDYKYLGLDNQWYPGRKGSKSDWDKKSVKLMQFKGTLEQYADELQSLSSALWIVGYDVGRKSGDYCGWKRFPKMLRALSEIEDRFRARGVRRGTVVSDLQANQQELEKRGCGEVQQMLKEGKK